MNKLTNIKHVLILFILVLSHTLVFAQKHDTLHLEQNKLIGKCSHPYFTGFEIELDTVYTRLDSAIFFNQLPRIGSVNFKNSVNIPTEFTLTTRAGYAQIMFRFRTDYLTFDSLLIEDQSIFFHVSRNPKVPATEKDLEIIRLAKKLLSKEIYWNKKDDRICTDDLANRSYSIYCALRIASIEIQEKYNHRNAVLQKLRHKIKAKYPTVKWNHRLMDYNNMDELNYSDVIEMIDEIEREFILELESKN